MEGVITVVILVGAMIFGVPVAWSFLCVLMYLYWVFEPNLATLMLQGYRSLGGTVLLALPLFVMAGYLMQSGGIARRLIDFIESMVRGRKGGIGASMIFSSAIFGAISGTASAAVASIGTVMIDPLEKRGYPRGYSSALLGVSSLLGILIPPSITMILFAVATRQSVAACFAASVGPAILLILGLVIFNRLNVGRKFEEIQTQSAEELGKSFTSKTLSALPALSMPLIILGGIYGGIFTPTEAAAVAVATALVIGFFIHRDLTLPKLSRSMIDAAATTGSIMLILLFSLMISKILAFQRIPHELSEAVTMLVSSPEHALLLVLAALVLAGMIMDDVSVTVVIAPLFLPLIVESGMNPIHFASVVATSVVIGANSPPVAPTLYMACKIGKVSVHKAVSPALMLMAFVALPVLLITTYWPALSLTLPRLLGYL
jgi:tripartite ATP-independent transporter DctM subunit